MIGAMMKAAMHRLITRAIAGPWKKSRMMARPTTGPEPAPKPCATRSASSVPMPGLSAQPTVAAM